MDAPCEVGRRAEALGGGFCAAELGAQREEVVHAGLLWGEDGAPSRVSLCSLSVCVTSLALVCLR